MKICVSSKTLQLQVKKALQEHCELFVVGYANQYISFVGIDEKIPLLTKNRIKDDYIGRIDIKQWSDILYFLSQLEEQPIVMEFTHYMHIEIHEFPEIEIRQITKRF